jgi:hypothetical protein
MPRIGLRSRKLIGMVALVVFMIVYAIAAMNFAVSQLQHSSPVVHLIFYFAAGFAWILPAGLIITWMQRPL